MLISLWAAFLKRPPSDSEHVGMHKILGFFYTRDTADYKDRAKAESLIFTALAAWSADIKFFTSVSC
jgi:hypothetical protein